MPATLALKHAALDQAVGYLGLITSISDVAAGVVTEVSPAGYARQLVAWSPNAAGAKENSTAITFPVTSGSAVYRYFGLWSSLTGGTLRFIWDSGGNKSYDATNQPNIATGLLDIDFNRTQP